MGCTTMQGEEWRRKPSRDVSRSFNEIFREEMRMAPPKPRRGPLAAADAFANRVYGSRYNPLYQSGTIAVALLLVLIVTGLWLVLFYRIGTPWESVARITGNPW